MREVTITVRVSPEEKAVIEREAQRQKLLPSTFVRRLVLLEAERNGTGILQPNNSSAGHVLADSGAAA